MCILIPVCPLEFLKPWASFSLHLNSILCKVKKGLRVALLIFLLFLILYGFRTWEILVWVFHYWFFITNIVMAFWDLSLFHSRVRQSFNYPLSPRLAAYIRQFGQFVLYIDIRMLSNNLIIVPAKFSTILSNRRQIQYFLLIDELIIS